MVLPYLVASLVSLRIVEVAFKWVASLVVVVEVVSFVVVVASCSIVIALVVFVAFDLVGCCCMVLDLSFLILVCCFDLVSCFVVGF